MRRSVSKLGARWGARAEFPYFCGLSAANKQPLFEVSCCRLQSFLRCLSRVLHGEPGVLSAFSRARTKRLLQKDGSSPAACQHQRLLPILLPSAEEKGRTPPFESDVVLREEKPARVHRFLLVF